MLEALEKQLQHRFHNIDLLEQALTHRSYLNEHPEYYLGHNERLEFLGDAILDFVVSDMLFKRYPNMSEGRMTRVRAALVRTETLAELASGLQLGTLLKMARGEEESGGRTRQTNLCNTFEAVIGALYLDDGMAKVREIAEPLFAPLMELVILNHADKDAKSRFQEWSQAELSQTPVYHTISSLGEDHDKSFTVEVQVGDVVVGWGNGKSKQSAEQAAARQALQEFAMLTEDD
jgi:ribonuclease-3